jgi:hypothetical protein
MPEQLHSQRDRRLAERGVRADSLGAVMSNNRGEIGMTSLDRLT